MRYSCVHACKLHSCNTFAPMLHPNREGIKNLIYTVYTVQTQYSTDAVYTVHTVVPYLQLTTLSVYCTSDSTQ